MRQGHVANPACVKFPQHAEIVVDGVAALDAQQHGNLAFLSGVLDFVARCGHGQIVRMKPDLLFHGAEQLKCAPRRRGPRNLDGHPQGEKNCADASLSQPGNIDAPFGVSAAQIKPIEQKSLWGIGVGVENEA